jgi:ATP-dependent Clp protease ATP-binding subunit ClpX
MFEIDGVELELTEEALVTIAAKALERKTGARGLRAILEETLQPIMFDIPSREDIDRVIVDRDVVLGEGEPQLIMRPDDVRREKSA